MCVWSRLYAKTGLRHPTLIDPILNKFSPDLVAQIDLASLATRGHHTQITSFSRVFKPPTMADLPSPSIKYHHSNLANNTIQPSTTPAHTTRHHRLAFPGFYHRRMMSYRRHHHTNKILHPPTIKIVDRLFLRFHVHPFNNQTASP